MNPVERVLDDEMGRLLDRLAASVPGGCLAMMVEQHPALRRRLEEAETHLAAARASMVEGYGRWRRLLEDVENLWALAGWRATVADPSASEEAAQQTSSIAA